MKHIVLEDQLSLPMEIQYEGCTKEKIYNFEYLARKDERFKRFGEQHFPLLNKSDINEFCIC